MMCTSYNMQYNSKIILKIYKMIFQQKIIFKIYFLIIIIIKDSQKLVLSLIQPCKTNL